MKHEQRAASRVTHRSHHRMTAPWQAVAMSLVGVICLVSGMVQPAEASAAQPPSGATGVMTVINMPLTLGTSGDDFGVMLLEEPPGGPFNIVIDAGETLAGNAAALAAFNRAAAQWEAFISDPITVTIEADLEDLDPPIIGSAGSYRLPLDFDQVRDAMVLDAADEADDGIVAHLPASAGFSALWPAGFTWNGKIDATKANLKAMGFAGLDDDPFGATDGIITFSTNYNFDFDNSDGVTAGHVDFETVAAHEIGHVLGFISLVDRVDELLDEGTPGATPVGAMDLFSFANDQSGQDPSNTSEFTTFPRLMKPGQERILDQIFPARDSDAEIPLSEGHFNGDGRQASHWKDDQFIEIETLIGMMDPTLGFGESWQITDSDLRAFDLIGYDITVPEPASLIVMATGALVVLRRKRRFR